MGRGECRASNPADLKKQQSHEVFWRMKCVGAGAGRPFKFKMNLEKTEYGDTAALVKCTMTSRKGASVPGSGDGAVSGPTKAVAFVREELCRSTVEETESAKSDCRF